MFDGLLYGKFSKNCKHCVKCINSRLLLIKKKTQATVKILKKDVADLLAYGHDSNAFGRMEPLIVEMNRAWCYDMIEYYCQCILNLLPSLQKLRECPEEAMEAISTLIFAAARFSDLPELDDLRQAFTEKYGSHMDSSINSQFVEKWRKKSFSTDEKLLLMKNIAEEFSVRWEFRAFQQNMFNSSPIASGNGRISSNTNEERSTIDLNGQNGNPPKSVHNEFLKIGKERKLVNNEFLKNGNESKFTYDESHKKEKGFNTRQPMGTIHPPCIKNNHENFSTRASSREHLSNLATSDDNYSAYMDMNYLKRDERREYEFKHKEHKMVGALSSEEKDERRRSHAMHCEESDEEEEEEEAMDRLLNHLSKKGRSNKPSRMRNTLSNGLNTKCPVSDDDLVARFSALKRS